MPTLIARSLSATRLFVLVLLAVLTGCKDEPAAGPATAPTVAAAALASGAIDGITFQYPSDWKLTRTADGKGINVTGPTDGDWETNVFLEIQPVQGKPALDEQLAANAELLGARKEDYQHRSTTEGELPSKLRFGRIEYANTSSEGSEKVKLQQWSVLIPIGEGKRLQVQAAAAADVWTKHVPTFEQIVNSIKLAK